MLVANFTTVRPEMGEQFCPCKTPLIAGIPSIFAINKENQQPLL